MSGRARNFHFSSTDYAEIRVDVCQRCHFVSPDAHEVDTHVPRRLLPSFFLI